MSVAVASKPIYLYIFIVCITEGLCLPAQVRWSSGDWAYNTKDQKNIKLDQLFIFSVSLGTFLELQRNLRYRLVRRVPMKDQVQYSA